MHATVSRIATKTLCAFMSLCSLLFRGSGSGCAPRIKHQLKDLIHVLRRSLEIAAASCTNDFTSLTECFVSAKTGVVTARLQGMASVASLAPRQEEKQRHFVPCSRT